MNPVTLRWSTLRLYLTAFSRLQLLQRLFAILNVVGFVDPPLHCNKFAAKAVSWFKLKACVRYFLSNFYFFTK